MEASVIGMVRFLLYGSVLLGIASGTIMVFAALGHNPQGVYTDHPADLILIFLGWAGVGCFPLSLMAVLADLYVIISSRVRG